MSRRALRAGRAAPLGPVALVALGLAGACGGTGKGTAETGAGAGDGTDGTDGTDGGDTTPLDPDTVPLAGACPQERRQGRFEVESNEDYAAVVGTVADGVVPTDVLTEMLVAGDCTIWRRENPFCDPGCASDETCSLDGVCVPYPQAQDQGRVTLAGLRADVAMDPVNPGNSYFDTSLPDPPWDDRAVLTLETAGGHHAPVTLHGVAPDPFTVTTPSWLLVPGADFTLAWTPPPEGARTEVVLSIRIDQHGLTPSSLRCTFPDTGAGTVPAAAFDKLVEFGITGFPTGEVERRTVDSSDLDDGGCVELVTTESRLGSLEIEGYTPCRRDEDCPEGETCNEPLERCE